MMQALKSISIDAAIELAPAIAATQAGPNIPSTGRYKFTPTTEIISHMQDLGYVLTLAKQASSGIPLRQQYGAHIVGFQHPDLYIKDRTNGGVEARPQIIMINSHDGTKPHTFEMGIFRLVCENGLIVKSMDMGGYKERHSKFDMAGIKSLMDEKITALPKTIDKINQWSGREMSNKERQQFAMDALLLRIGDDRQPEAYEINSILESRRAADNDNSLWTVFNRVQENLTKGGFQMNNRQARAISNPWQDMQLNQGIWQLADNYMSSAN